jgi:hypothetical protein
MKTKVFNFVKPSLTATLNSNRISDFISRTLKVPLTWDDQVCAEPLDILIIVNGPYAFCAHREQIGKAIEQAKRIVWVQNDYTVIPPKPTTNAESPFRAAWRVRAQHGKPHMDFWTTVQESADATPLSSYVNWNSMSYETPPDLETLRRNASRDLFYFGAYRKGRETYFHRYFDDCPVPVSISGAKPEWKKNWPNANVLPAMKPVDIPRELAKHGLGLYIEDKKSHSHYHSPASRFYEMLGAGLPMVFQPESVPMLTRGGFDVRRYVINSMEDIPRFMRQRETVRKEQHNAWATDYVGKLRRALLRAYDKVKEGV